MIFLIDYNIEGQAQRLWTTIQNAGWLDWLSLQFVTFKDVQLSITTSDRNLWHFAQDKNMIVLTANRNMEGQDSLEETIRTDNQAHSLPVVTIARVDRFHEKNYRERCAARLIEIVIELENLRGTGRIYIP